ncbi:MAG: aminomethyl-transferring glycine dehydrogenase subunit GcvPB [Opitutales bacterium]|nr:aminomethyl-transferring glycine dehydrogenase subunit GcvPB [Opitutales bacterium]NRA26972.1 aminomethyl-transferring glycine dehydrogenase subunit GcvPB [Opitutales bacterium]
MPEIQREAFPHYLGLNPDEQSICLKELGFNDLAELMAIPTKERLESMDLPKGADLEGTLLRLKEIAGKNRTRLHFLGDGLPVWKTQSVVSHVSGLRRLATAYTPYQPERSQGTLLTQWIYQCLLSQITGFEAVNASLYERSTAIFEGICCALRLKRKTSKVWISEAIYPGDRAVIETLARDTDIEIGWVPVDAQTGRIDIATLDTLGIEATAALVFPQINTFGNLEEVDALTNWAHTNQLLAIAIIDPMLLATGGLKAPVNFGEKGADIIVGEAQHLAIGPNFGGPGLGLFGVRFNDQQKSHIRQTPGRFVGEGKDVDGKDCHVMVLSTREQHIRRDKATSNICSNQAFLATLAGAAMLERGENGWQNDVTQARAQAQMIAQQLSGLDGVDLAFPETPFFNEFTVKISKLSELVLQQDGLIPGVVITERIPNAEPAAIYLKISLSDIHDETDCTRLISHFEKVFAPAQGDPLPTPGIPAHLMRSDAVELPEMTPEAVKDLYSSFDRLNMAPEEACYPLGSCTMKYNPYLNELAASLPGFTELHPQVPLEDAQGCLEVLWETQEWFRKITGLAGVTTQPVAGAQGELVGLKLFQAYHRDHSATERDIIIIPKSAHGTNFATAIVAGYPDKKLKDRPSGIALLNADSTGCVDMGQLQEILDQHGPHIAGIMVTNPNTGGVLEKNFRKMADAVHAVGGLVYMDGANMNAIAGWLDLSKLGVDAVHNNTHKTWSIPHGGGGPGDAFVGVSERLAPYLPGVQINKNADGSFTPTPAEHSIGSVHRHWGNFAHKVRAYTYLLRLGSDGVPAMSANAVLAARTLKRLLSDTFPFLPEGTEDVPRMHEFIITLPEEDFQKLEAAGIARGQAIMGFGKLLLDLGYHAPTVAFPEPLGLMFEPTESYTLAELERLAQAVKTVRDLYLEAPALLAGAPWLMPTRRVDEVAANRNVVMSRNLKEGLPPIPELQPDTERLFDQSIETLKERIKNAAAKPTCV